MRKKIAIKGKESDKGYLDDMQPSQGEAKTIRLSKSFSIDKSLADKIAAYIYKRRTEGDIYYSQRQLFHTALEAFFKTHK